jgi:1,2-diacylglycerol 3-alpha-glucosyltransferase
MKRLKIGLFIDTFFPMIDGVIMVVDNYARRLAKFNDVTVFAPAIPGKESDDTTRPYKVVRAKSIPLFFIDYSLPAPAIDKNFKQELEKSDLDIVHIHSPFSIGKIGIKYAKKHNIPVIATMHSQFKQDFMRAIKINFIANILTNKVVKVFDKCDNCYAVNSEIARIFHEEYGVKKLPDVLNNATDMLPVEDIVSAREEINKKYNISDDEKVFLFVGRINILKNILFIVDSLKILKDRDFKFKMLYVGSGQDEEKLKEKIEKLQLGNDVLLCGRVTDRELMKKVYARADLFLFPSLYDASSLVQVEAASQHTPTIFIEGAATAATVTNNVNGIISKNSIEDYANQIEKMITDNELYKKISDGAFRDLYKNWDDTVKEMYEIYLKMI